MLRSYFLTLFASSVIFTTTGFGLEGFPVALKALHPELEPNCATCHDIGAGVAPAAENLASRGRVYYGELMAHEAALNAGLGTVEDVLTSVDFNVFGDTRTQADIHRQVVSAICAETPGMTLHTGDIVATGSDMSLWREAMQIEDCLLRTHLLKPACGNHEGSYCTNNPLRQALGNTTRYYVNEFKGLTFLILDSNDIDRDQLTWLRALPVGPHYIPVFHHAPYPTMAGHGPDAGVVQNFVPEFRRLGVRLAFNGHNHGYDRAVVDGVTYVSIGGGGAPLYPCGPARSYTQFCMSDYSYVRCGITGSVVECNTRRLSGEIIDRFSATY